MMLLFNLTGENPDSKNYIFYEYKKSLWGLFQHVKIISSVIICDNCNKALYWNHFIGTPKDDKGFEAYGFSGHTLDKRWQRNILKFQSKKI